MDTVYQNWYKQVYLPTAEAEPVVQSAASTTIAGTGTAAKTTSVKEG